MKVKRYEAENIQEAVYKVKMDLGPDATILYVKEVLLHRPFRLSGRKKKIEVIAGIEESEKIGMNALQIEMLQYELREMKGFMRDILQQNGSGAHASKLLPPPLQNLHQRLVDCGLAEEIIGQLITHVQERATEKELKDQKTLDEILVKQIARLIDVAAPAAAESANRIVAFVGPTGVGKTTTIAKLAANFTLLEKKKVALITIDTYRIAAVEQLKTYAEIMGIPIEVVFTPKELMPAVQKHKDKDFILIDTAGRNPLNDAQMEELKNFLGQDADIEVQLLISLTTNLPDIIEIFKRFEVSKVHRLIFTKLDEVTAFGAILSAVHRAKRPISYITTGQNVPEDIEPADAYKLAKLILTRETNVFANKVKAGIK